MLKRIWLGFKAIFRDPKDIHRVFAVIPLAALTSHIVYLYLSMPKGVPLKQDGMVTMYLVGVLYFGWLSWIFLSNEFDIELSMRFFWAAGLSGLWHRVFVMDNEIGGSLYFKIIATLAIGTMMVFVITGKTKNELKIWFSMKLNESKNVKQAKIYPIGGSSDDDQRSTGS